MRTERLLLSLSLAACAALAAACCGPGLPAGDARMSNPEFRDKAAQGWSAREGEVRQADADRRARLNPATAEKFNQVRDGMTYDQVKAVMGVDGRHVAHAGAAGETADEVSWQNQDGSNMVVTFGNGRVSGKAQFGLR